MTYAIYGLFAGGAAALSSRFIAVATFFRHCQEAPVDFTLGTNDQATEDFFLNSQFPIKSHNRGCSRFCGHSTSPRRNMRGNNLAASLSPTVRRPTGTFYVVGLTQAPYLLA
jgi:hypothetical protein